MLLDLKASQNFRSVLLAKTGLKVFPITHTYKYRQANVIDLNNIIGRGCNALYSATGQDKSQLLYVASSLEEYLRNHYYNLR